jgi:hypothetical protein
MEHEIMLKFLFVTVVRVRGPFCPGRIQQIVQGSRAQANTIRVCAWLPWRNWLAAGKRIRRPWRFAQANLNSR